jgi:hypothetical protein
MLNDRRNDLMIRVARPDDADALRRLAELDSALPLTGTFLLAEVDGTPVAAISLPTGAVTADPFERTSNAIRMLTLRRYHLLRQGGEVAPARLLLRRLVPSGAR